MGRGEGDAQGADRHAQRRRSSPSATAPPRARRSKLAAEVIAELEQRWRGEGVAGLRDGQRGGRVGLLGLGGRARRSFPTWTRRSAAPSRLRGGLQDPLAELVKIDPKAIGVGMYQHDVDQQALATALDRVVVSCVNFAGVDVNVASAQLLRYVSGVSSRVAEHIVAHRAANGPFTTRAQLQEGGGPRSGDLRAGGGLPQDRGGKEPLDNTFIHPESYDAARALLARLPDAGEKIPERVRAWRY